MGHGGSAAAAGAGPGFEKFRREVRCYVSFWLSVRRERACAARDSSGDWGRGGPLLAAGRERGLV